MSGLHEPLVPSSDSVEFASLLEESSPHTLSHSVQNLDLFLSRVYYYFLGKGFYCILLRHCLNLLTVLFTVLFAMFLVTYIDYGVLSRTNDWSKAVNLERKPHVFTLVCFAIFGLFWVWQFLQFLREIKQNWEIKNFCSANLRMTESEFQTAEWREIAQQLAKVPRLCVTKPTLTSLDIVHRIMRKENYLIALINKDLLNLRLPLPFLRPKLVITKTIEWGLTFALFNYIFDEHNAVKRDVLSPSKKEAMSKRLRKRFILMGIASLFLSPFIFIYLLVYFFFKYGEEIKNKPGSTLGSREWSSLARWKFREFNELPHYFQNRLSASYVASNRYIDQFPTNMTTIIARFVSFISGALLAVILLLGLWDDNIVMYSEVEGRSLLWYAGVLGTILTVCRSVIPDEHAIFNPKQGMEEIETYTHYVPKHWQGREHTLKVRDEFCELFEYKIIIFLREIFSVLFAPFILMFSLPQCSGALLNFFREFTVNAEGVGFVCACATFSEIEKHGNVNYGAKQSGTKQTRMKQGKLEKSIITFKANNPEWVPPPDSERMFSNLASFVHSNELERLMPNSDPHALAMSMSVLYPDTSDLTHSNPISSVSNLDPESLGILLKVLSGQYCRDVTILSQ